MKKNIFFFFFLFSFAYNAYAYEYEVAIAAIFKNEAPYFKEWIEYHKMIGVEHFWVYDNLSTDNPKEVLQPYIDEGLVEFIDWPVPSRNAFMGYQCMAYQHAIKNTVGRVKWLALIDVDEFLLPLQDKNLKECLNNRFKDAGAIYVNWKMFGTSKAYLKKGEPILFHLFKCAKREYGLNVVGKTIIRPEFAEIEYFWHPHFCQLKKGDYYYGDGKKLPLTNIGGEYKDLRTDGKTHDGFIRLNHYYFRDENFYKNVRMKRVQEHELLFERYKMCSKDKDFRMMSFIKYKYPEMYRSFWNQ